MTFGTYGSVAGGFGGKGSGGGTGGGVGLGGDGFSGMELLVKNRLLQRFAVNLINANNAAYEIPVLLI
jgi:hypothetical protein